MSEGKIASREKRKVARFLRAREEKRTIDYEYNIS